MTDDDNGALAEYYRTGPDNEHYLSPLEGPDEHTPPFCNCGAWWPCPEATDDLPFLPPATAPMIAPAKPRKCRHPREAREAREVHGESEFDGTHIETFCTRCRCYIDGTVARRGRNNRQRGNAIEREVGKRLGLRRVGQYGGPDDLSNEMFAAQVKSGGTFPERFWRWLKAVPVKADQTALLVVTDAPGPGHRRRAVVVLDLDDWRALHGPVEEAA